MNATHKTISEYMMKYTSDVERAMGRKLKPDEVRIVLPEARQYAKNLYEWKKKGQKDEHKLVRPE